MIFLTVGTQLPFDRLVGAVADWQAAAPRREIFAQIGESALEPGFPHVASLSMEEHEARLQACEVVVSHVGMGTILTCVAREKPLIAMPRRAELGEHRNDHQAATAARLLEKLRLCVVEDAADLAAALDGPREHLLPVLRAGETPHALSSYLNALAGRTSARSA